MTLNKSFKMIVFISSFLLLTVLIMGCGGSDSDAPSADGGLVAAREMAEEMGKADGFDEEVTQKVLEVDGILNGFAVVNDDLVDVHLLYPQDAELTDIHSVDQEVISMIKEEYPDLTVNNVGGTIAE